MSVKKPDVPRAKPVRAELPNREDILVCFAVKEESGEQVRSTGCNILITGMGRKNAAEAIRAELSQRRYRLVITCGFAGGLNPELSSGCVVFSEDSEAPISYELRKLGARPGKFHCAKRVAITAEEKRELWKTTTADAIEMESSVIRTICSEQGLPSATVRVILDTADEDLPLDFNALMTSHDKINYPKLIATILLSPRKFLKLGKFWRQSAAAARELDGLLASLLQRIN